MIVIVVCSDCYSSVVIVIVVCSDCYSRVVIVIVLFLLPLAR